MQKKVSLKDIAQRVGVSTALVSYVLSGNEEKGRVGKDTAQKIREAAAALNYQPNHIAKSLKTGKTNTIGLIVADISNPFFATIARGIEDESSKFGLTTIMGSSDESPEKLKKLVDVFMKRQVDGFIISPADHSEETIQYIRQVGMPLCLIDRCFKTIETNYVITDNYYSMFDAVIHLKEEGKTNMALITYKSNLQHMQDRKLGFLKASQGQDVKVFEIDYFNQTEELKEVIEEVLNDKKWDTLVFSTNTLSIAGLKLLTQRGLQIPKDMHVLCFDASEVYDFFEHPILHVKQPIEKLAEESVRILVNQINNVDQVEQVVLNSKLIAVR
ncbi:LacI family DNA-binding transcriptional regulator [Sphingobacterium sp. HJSM2_6]|uniref:LacI family DNA-binding transcriptional regulator n=1 Tax=Sphingobacterium sp. HJSM2_6 TaxID=3366264 RepID=UPI003BC1FB82